MSLIAIDFLLGPDLLSRLIAWYGEGYGGYSHAANLLQDGTYIDSRVDVIDGVPPGVQVRKPETERRVRYRRATLAVDPETYERWEAHLRRRIGASYDRASILGFITGRSESTVGHWICSALALDGLQYLGLVPRDLPTPPHQVTPNALLLLLAAVGFNIGPEEWTPC